MEAYFFGPEDRQLFGAYSPPLSAWPKSVGVLICPPLGQEYMRTHRGLHSLATALAREGLHVLRFDYFGTGDSAGESVDATWSSCSENVAAACQELIEISGATDIVLIGMRLGANLAFEYAASSGHVARVVLWDPVVKGSEYLEDTQRITRIMLADFDRFPNPRRASGALAQDERVGHRMGDAMKEAIRSIDLRKSPWPQASVDVVFSPSVRRKQTTDEWVTQSKFASDPLISDEGYWSDHALVEVAYLPSMTVQKVVKAVAK